MVDMRNQPYANKGKSGPHKTTCKTPNYLNTFLRDGVLKFFFPSIISKSQLEEPSYSSLQNLYDGCIHAQNWALDQTLQPFIVHGLFYIGPTSSLPSTLSLTSSNVAMMWHMPLNPLVLDDQINGLYQFLPLYWWSIVLHTSTCQSVWLFCFGNNFDDILRPCILFQIGQSLG